MTGFSLVSQVKCPAAVSEMWTQRWATYLLERKNWYLVLIWIEIIVHVLFCIFFLEGGCSLKLKTGQRIFKNVLWGNISLISIGCRKEKRRWSHLEREFTPRLARPPLFDGSPSTFGLQRWKPFFECFVFGGVSQRWRVSRLPVAVTVSKRQVQLRRASFCDRTSSTFCFSFGCVVFVDVSFGDIFCFFFFARHHREEFFKFPVDDSATKHPAHVRPVKWEENKTSVCVVLERIHFWVGVSSERDTSWRRRVDI